MVDGVATLAWLANLAAIELHTPQWRLTGKVPANPDLLVVDLDPGPPAGLDECCLVAVAAKHRLEMDGLSPLAKTSGKKGMQLLARLDGSRTSDEVSGYAKGVAEDLEEALPDLVTAKMTKSLRPGKVFFDWSQNAAAKTTVSAYSLRAAADADGLGTLRVGRGRGGAGTAVAPGRGAGPAREERRPARRPPAPLTLTGQISEETRKSDR